jgi:alpha-L-rhamnosidase
MKVDSTLLVKAEQLVPTLIRSEVYPTRSVHIIADEQAFQGWRVDEDLDPLAWNERALYKGDSIVLDFGEHCVGYIHICVKPIDIPVDAPLKLKLIFGEMPCEIGESFDMYRGWLSSSWLQEETMIVDALPAELNLTRRYSFRYMKIMVVDTSLKYKVTFEKIVCATVTSGHVSILRNLPMHVPTDLQEIDRISRKTLQDCMQTVFEDGPKRDRRLWIGDLRLQAQANYVTFRNIDLVKRCMYLFASLRHDNGAVGACVYEKPTPRVDDIYLYDYALLFVACLYDYFEATKDRDTLRELWPVVMEQLEIGIARLDDRGIVKDDSSWWCFIDWHSELNKQASAQGVLVYCLKYGLKLATALGLEDTQLYIANYIKQTSLAARTYMWDNEQCFFVSGESRQVSWASQIWMALAEILPPRENAKMMDRLFEKSPGIEMKTPYMYHYLIEALYTTGNHEKATEQIRKYWGGMVMDGADTFWEVYSPLDSKLSPYGSYLINSYCHAWSCTPTYFIRKNML